MSNNDKNQKTIAGLQRNNTTANTMASKAIAGLQGHSPTGMASKVSWL
jgi:hypothetical protein